jgi:hypothetical protein
VAGRARHPVWEAEPRPNFSQLHPSFDGLHTHVLRLGDVDER